MYYNIAEGLFFEWHLVDLCRQEQVSIRIWIFLYCTARMKCQNKYSFISWHIDVLIFITSVCFSICASTLVSVSLTLVSYVSLRNWFLIKYNFYFSNFRNVSLRINYIKYQIVGTTCLERVNDKNIFLKCCNFFLGSYFLKKNRNSLV